MAIGEASRPQQKMALAAANGDNGLEDDHEVDDDDDGDDDDDDGDDDDDDDGDDDDGDDDDDDDGDDDDDDDGDDDDDDDYDDDDEVTLDGLNQKKIEVLWKPLSCCLWDHTLHHFHTMSSPSKELAAVFQLSKPSLPCILMQKNRCYM